MNNAMSGDAGNAETCTLLQRHALGDLNDLSDKNDGVLGGGSERTVGLSTILPYPPPNPFLRDSIAHCINSTRPIAMRNHTRIRHPYPKCVLAFLDIARIYTGKSDANSNPACLGLWVLHLTHDQGHPEQHLASHSMRPSCFIPFDNPCWKLILVVQWSFVGKLHVLVRTHERQNKPHWNREPLT